jgi:hypothetical protein
MNILSKIIQDMDTPSLHTAFQKKYEDFGKELAVVFPELELELACAIALKCPESINRYNTEVFKKHEKRGPENKCPGIVLPGVVIEPSMWVTISKKSQDAIYQYLSILDLFSIYEHASATDIYNHPELKEWADNITKEWRGRLDKMDFQSLSEKFKDLFGAGGAIPSLPEKFLKGKLAKLAEDLVREFKPEDFGLRPEDIAAVEKDPTRAFEILMQASSSKPHVLQNAMNRVSKKLQEKIKRGQLKPEELAHEAEELMHEFQSHPAFAEMMKAFKSAFSFEDPAAARAAGRDNESRLSIVKARLRAKLEAKRAAEGGGKKK